MRAFLDVSLLSFIEILLSGPTLKAIVFQSLNRPTLEKYRREDRGEKKAIKQVHIMLNRDYLHTHIIGL